jgi:hypothetical protein
LMTLTALRSVAMVFFGPRFSHFQVIAFDG